MGNDFVISYSLDNYITIQGMFTINGKTEWKNDSGYLLDNIEEDSNGIYYRGSKIEENEQLKEWIIINGSKNEYPYIKLNGVKYYKDKDNTWFSIVNGEKYQQPGFKDENNLAIQYYKDALAFKERILNEYHLGDLKASHARGEDGDTLQEIDENGNRTGKPKFGSDKIFDFGDMNGTSIEDPNSNFNQHRLAVIRYSIEKNLSIAIANYNNYSNVSTNFQMPKLREDEWEKILNQISIISFLQGLNIGGKVYNGYSIITNNKNQEVINEDSIYMVTDDNQYHRANDKDLKESNNIVGGFLNIDFERKSIVDVNTKETQYFIPKQLNGKLITGCYTSIVNQTNVEATDNFYQYMQKIASENSTLASKYFTALGRERYSMYRTNNDPEKLKQKFLEQPQP